MSTTEQGVCYIVKVSTGCTCCSNENFMDGPYRRKDSAEARGTFHKIHRTLSSQYAEDGHQNVIEIPYEIAGDWIILDERYATKGPFLDDAPNERWEDELTMFGRDHRL